MWSFFLASVGSLQFVLLKIMNRGNKHDFPFIYICKVLREVLKTEDEA